LDEPSQRLASASLIATWFGAGLVPVAPGTVGSLAALPFAWAIDRTFGKPALGLAGALLFLIGIWASGHYAERTGVADPAEVLRGRGGCDVDRDRAFAAEPSGLRARISSPSAPPTS